MSPFDRLGRFVARRAWLVVGAWALVLLAAMPLAPRVPGVLSAGGFILDDLESARAKALLGTELGLPPSALVVVFSSPTLEAGTPAFEAAAAAAVARHRGGAARRPRRAAPPRAAPGLGRPATPPTTSSSSTCRPTTRPRRSDPPRAAPRGARPRRRAGRRAGVLRRRPERLRGGPPAERGHLAAARRAGAALRLRLGRWRPACRSSWAARRSWSRWRASSSSRSVMPMSIFVLNLATLLGSRPRRRLLAAADEPLPRGAGRAGRTAPSGSPRRSG